MGSNSSLSIIKGRKSNRNEKKKLSIIYGTYGQNERYDLNILTKRLLSHIKLINLFIK